MSSVCVTAPCIRGGEGRLDAAGCGVKAVRDVKVSGTSVGEMRGCVGAAWVSRIWWVSYALIHLP